MVARFPQRHAAAASGAHLEGVPLLLRTQRAEASLARFPGKARAALADARLAVAVAEARALGEVFVRGILRVRVVHPSSARRARPERAIYARKTSVAYAFIGALGVAIAFAVALVWAGSNKTYQS